MLEERSNESRLSQSNFIRNLIRYYTDSKLFSTNIDNVLDNILNITDDLSKFKIKLHYLGYFNEVEFLQNIIDSLNKLMIKDP